MFWVPDLLARELKIDNPRPLLTDWQIDADNQGAPSLKIRPSVGPTTNLILIMKNSDLAFTLTVLAVLANDAPGTDRQSAYPVGDPLELAFCCDGQNVVKAVPPAPWKQLQKDGNENFVYGGGDMITHADLQRLARLQNLEITDNFPNSIRDFSITTNLFLGKMLRGAALLVDTRFTK